MKTIFRSVLILSLLLFALSSASFAQDSPLNIVASNSILADVVSNVVGDVATVTATIPRGADPHSFAPTPADLTALADADVVFVNGALFEEGLLEAIENAGGDANIVTASACVQIIAIGEHDHEEDDDHASEEEHAAESAQSDLSEIAQLCEQHYAEMVALHEAGHDHEAEMAHEEADNHEDGEEHDHDHIETLGPLYALDCGTGHDHEAASDEHDHGICDPHVWLEPHNVMYWTMLIRDVLVELDPVNADTYTANATAYLAELDALAHDFINPLVATLPTEQRILVTNHDSLGYFAAAYDFTIIQALIAGGSTIAEPSAAEVANVIDAIRENGVVAIFAETTLNDTLIQVIAQETGVSVAYLYSGTLSEEGGPASTYIEYMKYNVSTIIEGLKHD
ncbi:MAG: zinc ABC transporter substrate-binding protein [Anaerolineae bacterium]|nr:zinc ABC transporter substrate-binding protein [Anaerolineae bacterium]